MKDKYAFIYLVETYYDDETTYPSGIGFAETLSEAAAILEDEYGSELMSIRHLEFIDEIGTVTLPWSVCTKLLKEAYIAPPTENPIEKKK